MRTPVIQVIISEEMKKDFFKKSQGENLNPSNVIRDFIHYFNIYGRRVFYFIEKGIEEVKGNDK